MFSNVDPNFIYCINKEKTLDGVKNQLSDYYISNCSYFCFKESLKMINKTEQCIDSCENDINNKYEYKSICYEKFQKDYFIILSIQVVLKKFLKDII